MSDNPQTENDIVVVANESGLQQNKTDELLKNFAGYFGKAKELANAAKDIVVTDESQTDLMLQARQSRLELKSIRVEVEKTRKSLKEQSLREGKAIDGISNLIKALIVPVEEHLEKQEKYIEIKEQARLSERENDRIAKISQYVDDLTPYKLRDMSDEAFDNLLNSLKIAKQAQKDAEKKAEEERKEREKKERLLQSRKLELAPYQDFVEGEIDENTSEKEFNSILTKAKNAKTVYDKKQEKIRQENEKLRKEKEAREKKDAEKKAQEEAERKIKEEAEKKALLAPDKEKINQFAQRVEELIKEAPAVKSNEANQVINRGISAINGLVGLLRNEAKKL